MIKTVTLSIALTVSAAVAFAAAHSMSHGVEASDQSAANGIVRAQKVMAPASGWMVVHRTDPEMKPGPVVGYAPLREGENIDVAVILTEEIMAGDMLMLMVHGEDGGVANGDFEYTLGATEDGHIKVDGNLVMTTITAE